MIWAQLFILLIITPLSYGPLARMGLSSSWVPNLFLLTTWLFAWLTNRSIALRWAIMVGLTIDLLNFARPGTWLLLYLLLVIGIDYVRGRYLEVSSFIEAMMTLLVCGLLVISINNLFIGDWAYQRIVFGSISNVLCGGVLYYVLAIRFKLFARWRGSQV